MQFDKNERYIVNGSHDAGKLQDLLDGFIRKFVLCQACDNPETKLVRVIGWFKLQWNDVKQEQLGFCKNFLFYPFSVYPIIFMKITDFLLCSVKAMIRLIISV